MGGGKAGFVNGAPMRVPPREAQDSSLADDKQGGHVWSELGPNELWPST